MVSSACRKSELHFAKDQRLLGHNAAMGYVSKRRRIEHFALCGMPPAEFATACLKQAMYCNTFSIELRNAFHARR